MADCKTSCKLTGVDWLIPPVSVAVYLAPTLAKDVRGEVGSTSLAGQLAPSGVCRWTWFSCLACPLGCLPPQQQGIFEVQGQKNSAFLCF